MASWIYREVEKSKLTNSLPRQINEKVFLDNLKVNWSVVELGVFEDHILTDSLPSFHRQNCGTTINVTLWKIGIIIKWSVRRLTVSQEVKCCNPLGTHLRLVRERFWNDYGDISTRPCTFESKGLFLLLLCLQKCLFVLMWCVSFLADLLLMLCLYFYW